MKIETENYQYCFKQNMFCLKYLKKRKIMKPLNCRFFMFYVGNINSSTIICLLIMMI